MMAGLGRKEERRSLRFALRLARALARLVAMRDRCTEDSGGVTVA